MEGIIYINSSKNLYPVTYFFTFDTRTQIKYVTGYAITRVRKKLRIIFIPVRPRKYWLSTTTGK